MRYLLDTNSISNIEAFTDGGAAGMDGRAAGRGPPHRLADGCRDPARILEKPAGKRRRELEASFSGHEGPQALFAGRVLPFDERAAFVWARLMAEGKAKGRPRSAFDMIIAAVRRGQ